MCVFGMPADLPTGQRPAALQRRAARRRGAPYAAAAGGGGGGIGAAAADSGFGQQATKRQRLEDAMQAELRR